MQVPDTYKRCKYRQKWPTSGRSYQVFKPRKLRDAADPGPAKRGRQICDRRAQFT